MEHILQIEVFRTSVGSAAEAQRVADLLLARFPGSKVNFDLNDCDKVLRVESGNCLPTEEILETVTQAGYFIQILE